MSDNMWKIKLEYKDIPTSPNKIIETQCNYLSELTHGKVIAKISSYDGPISSYTTTGIDGMIGFLGQVAINASIAGTPRKVEIQEDLGEVGESLSQNLTFEFYISSTSKPNYKYRIMFLRHDIGYYPLIIVLDEEIASEINKKSELSCDNEQAFKYLLDKIINSTKVKQVIQNLYTMAIKDEK